MRLALAQMVIKWHNIDVNLEKCLKFIEEAVKNNVDFIVFPEMCLTGYTMKIDRLPDDETYILDWFKDKAKKYNINIGMGYSIKNDDKGDNRFTIVSRRGELLSSYSKIHPFSKASEDIYYNKGENIVYAKVDDSIVSTFICYDLRFPEIFQEASKKAQIIIVAAAWPDVRAEHFDILLRARALENQCFIAGVNRFGYGGGLHYSGHSQIISPFGEVLVFNNTNEALLIQDINVDMIDKARLDFNIKKDRREKLYKEFY